MNKIDQTIQKYKNFQSMIRDNDKCLNDIYLESEKMIAELHECSKLIEDKFKDISQKVTEHANTGKWQG